MLREISPARQVPNDYFRRLFCDEYFDLCVWHKTDGTFYGFQLGYDLTGKARALTWMEDQGFSHHTIDSGEESPLVNRTPTLTPEKNLNPGDILQRLGTSDKNLPPAIRDFLRNKVMGYGGNQEPGNSPV